MRIADIIALIAGTCAMPAQSQRWRQSPAEAAQETGSGTNGVLTDNLDSQVSGPRGRAAYDTTIAVANISAVYGTCLASTKTTITDCQAVLEDISGRNGIITVAPGFCLNWWEGTCLARICGKDRVFSANSDSLVEKMRSLILGPCIAKGETGVVADTPSWNSTAGTYRLFLETYVGI